MSTQESTGGRWLVASFVILAAVGVTLLLRPSQPPPKMRSGPGTGSSGEAADPLSTTGVPFEWSDGPELDRRYDLNPTEAFVLDLDAGRVEVLPGQGGSARVQVGFEGGTRPPAELVWEHERSESGTRVRIRSRSSRSWLARLFGPGEAKEILVEGERKRVSAERARVGLVQVALPPDAPLRVRTGAGSVTVRDHRSPVTIESGAGDVTLVRIAASVEVATGAGDIQLEDIAGDAEIDTGAGSVTAVGVVGAIHAATGAGRVRVDGAPAAVTVSSGAGGVDGILTAVLGPIDIQTRMGGISLALPADAQAELFAQSGLGSVQAELGGTRLRQSRGEPLTATLGGGGPRIALRTRTGGIRVSEATRPESGTP